MEVSDIYEVHLFNFCGLFYCDILGLLVVIFKFLCEQFLEFGV